MKVAVTDYIEPDLEWETEQVQGMGAEFVAAQLKSAAADELLKLIRDADVVVVNMAPLTESVIDRLERCRLVIRHGIGYDNVDVEALSARNIPLANIPDYCVEEVAEHAIALMLALGRKIFPSQQILTRSAERGQWDFSGIEPIFRMSGRTVGIVGCGRIGSRVFQKLQTFGFKFLICDPEISSKRKGELGIETVDLSTLLHHADFVSLHAPLKEDTIRMINGDTLNQMKESAYLVNTARAGLIDHDALFHALKVERISGAALDVFEQEPPSPQDRFFELDNVILTPHLSWCSVEAGWDIRRKIVDELRRFAEGLPPRSCVNPETLSGSEVSR